MKYKVTIASLRPSDDGYDSDTEFLQVIELDESPAPEIARLLNPEPEYEEKVEEEPEDDFHQELDQALRKPTLPPNFGTIEAEKEITRRSGRQIGYDRDAVIADLKANVLTVAQIADKHGITKSNVYQIKSKYVREEEIAPDIEPYPYGPKQEPEDPPPTAYQEARERLDETKSTADTDLVKKIEELVAMGCSMSELEMAFPSVPLAKLQGVFDSFMDR
jgi:hypothetical protein